MANLTITVPDAVVARVFDALAAVYGYDPSKDGTKAQFARRCIAQHVKGVVLQHETSAAMDSVRSTLAAADAKVQSEIVLS